MKRLLFLLIIGLAGAVTLVWLGVWQMNRLEEKQGFLAEMQARIDADPVELPANPDPKRDRYLAVKVSGAILPRELHVLVSQKQVGAGYRIIAPFQTDDGRRILLDRGFVPVDARDNVRRIGPAEVSGNLHWPDETDTYTPKPERGTETWFARDVDAMAQVLDTEPVMLIAATDLDPGVSPLPVDTAAIPNDHLQYAITWFSLAVIWIGMTGHFLWRTRARRQT